MVRDSSTHLDQGRPYHVLGQYLAWRLAASPSLPVDLAWISIADANSPASHKLLPHGEPSIAIRRRRTVTNALESVELVVCGPYYKTGQYTPEAREELIAFRLKPEFSAAVFNIAPQDYGGLSTTNAPLELMPFFANALKCAEFAEASDVLIAVKSDILNLAASRKIPTGPEAATAEWMRQSEGKIMFRDIASKLDVSERNLRRRFIDHVGCRPKTYARYLKITAAALAAEKMAKPDWAAVAADAGFHDQPHMINSFQAEIGMTPKAFHAERRTLVSQTPLSGFCNT
ncbi:helix-turn-helix domain-containing protein [Hyphococcus flavus]|uniref:Helix-turn-helix domain-containing protein n=1 Tax=Hyphococcus flavus TaxID=1866326 RepID=A0AAF0CFD9_9PROT|nr:helix-turn-helix domain-containing protein [Hyphococcus flavus]WDI32381.1 helix-turn-helix domain-containing protein [Hyphococcus flavus]